MKRIIVIAIFSMWTMAGVNQWNMAQEAKMLPYPISAADAAEIEKARQTVQLTAAPNPPEDGDLFIWKDATLDRISTVTNYFTTNVVYDHNGRWENVNWYTNGQQSFNKTTNGMTEQWWITNIVQIHVLKFLWRGKERIISEDALISSTTNFQIMRAEWITTNDVPSNQKGFATDTIWLIRPTDSFIISP